MQNLSLLFFSNWIKYFNGVLYLVMKNLMSPIQNKFNGLRASPVVSGPIWSVVGPPFPNFSLGNPLRSEVFMWPGGLGADVWTPLDIQFSADSSGHVQAGNVSHQGAERCRETALCLLTLCSARPGLPSSVLGVGVISSQGLAPAPTCDILLVPSILYLWNNFQTARVCLVRVCRWVGKAKGVGSKYLFRPTLF